VTAAIRDIPGAVTSFMVGPNETFGIYDAVQVHLIDHGQGRGGMTVACYDMAWTCYFGAMGERGIREFVISASAGYLANKMRGQFSVRTKTHEKYREQVIETIKAALASRSQTNTRETHPTVMNPPVPAAEGTEAGNQHALTVEGAGCHGDGVSTHGSAEARPARAQSLDRPSGIDPRSVRP
jgi:hypothetical protein